MLEAESVQRAVVAGHSLGGLVALRLARNRPELVRGLLLVAPAGIATTTRWTLSASSTAAVAAAKSSIVAPRASGPEPA
ncbi:MAG: alpha/beta fold hydrolase [Solirubrobacterales bacterium]